MWLARFSAVLIAGSLAACSGADAEPAHPPLIDWHPCSWSAEKTDSLAECASVDAPLDVAAGDARKMRLSVKRRRARATARAQLWLLAGGPGDAATEDMELLARGAPSLVDDVDLYAVDHRGTGGSEPLVCTSPDLVECGRELEREHGERLAFFSSTASAHDLAWLTEHLTPAGTQLFIYGGSYGTYLAQRYLSLYPDRADAVILEGVARPSRPLSGYDEAMNGAGAALFTRCAASVSCSGHFDAEPWGQARRAVAALDAGACAKLRMSADGARTLLAAAALATELMPFVPALAFRIARCSDDDVTRVLHFAARLAALGSSTGRSSPLGVHVAISELLASDAPARASRLRDALHTYTLASGLESSLSAAAAAWPAYSPPPAPEAPSYAGPLLMLQGALDPASPVAGAREAAAGYFGPLQRLVVFGDAAHDVIGATPTSAGQDCAQTLYARFLRDPEQPLDESCVADVVPVDFEGDRDIEQYFFGGSAWD